MPHVRLEPDPRIVVRFLPNLRIREFHVNKRISDEQLSKLEGSLALWLEENKSKSTKTIGIASDFYNIDGVQSVSVDFWYICIVIRPAFDWNDIQPRVIDLIQEILEWSYCDDVVPQSWD